MPNSIDESYGVYHFLENLYNLDVNIVVAAGNFGPLVNTLNPLALCPWVISVGAATINGRTLADFSSRGIPESFTNCPSLVAPGVDVITPWVEEFDKPKELLEKEQNLLTSERFEKQIGRPVNISTDELLSKWTIRSGTSFSTPMVAGMIARLIQMRRFLNLPHDVFTIKSVILEMTVSMEGYMPHEVGAGFLGTVHINEYFKNLDTQNSESEFWGYTKELSNLWSKCLGEGVDMVIME